MKSSMKKVVLGSTTILAAGVATQAVKAASTNVPIQAIILDPISITQTRVMNFGILTNGTGAGGTATLDNADTITGTTGTVSTAGGTLQSGGFKISATTGVTIDVTGPASTTIDDVGAGVPMTVDQFTINGAAGTINATAFTTALGAATVTGFRLGGRLTVGAAQLAGTYTGSVAITANYQ